MQLTNNIDSYIGNTPVVSLKRYAPSPKIQIYAKIGGLNPGGSIKDRVANFLINSGEKQGKLSKNKTIIEATSGNTGIGLAMISAIKGYKFLAVMPQNTSTERQKLIKQYGAQIHFTDPHGGSNHAIKIAESILQKNPEKYVMLNQYKNLANPESHYQTTAPELIKQVPKITHFVAGIGTGGTLTGIGKKLKEYNPDIQIVGIEPTHDIQIPGLRNMISYTPDIFDKRLIDKQITIDSSEAAIQLRSDLVKYFGLSVGISSGAALWGVIELSKSLKSAIITTIFPDNGDRYLGLV